MATRKQILDNNNNEILPITDTEAVRNPQSVGGTLESRLQNIEEDKGHFKGWFNSLADLKAAYTAEEGDAAYVKDASPATTWSIYVYDSTASSDNYWADIGTDADTSNVQTFASGEEVNEVHIVNDLTIGGATNVLSAEQGKKLDSKIQQAHFNAVSLRNMYDQLIDVNDENYLVGYQLNGTTGQPQEDHEESKKNVSGWIPVKEGEVYTSSNPSNTRGYYYDDNKTFLSRSYINGSNTVPPNAKWMRVNFYQSSMTDSFIVCKGSSLSTKTQRKIYSDDVVDGAITNSKISDGAITTDKIGTSSVITDKITNGAVTTDKIGASSVTTPKIQNKAVTLDKCDFVTAGKNLFNPNDTDIVVGKFLNDNGNNSSNANYIISGYIPFTQQDEYLISSINGVLNNEGAGNIWLYDSTKTKIDGSGSRLSANGGIATWQEGAAYARFSIYSQSETFTNIQIEVGQTMTSYEPYSVGIDGSKIVNIDGGKINDNSIPLSKLNTKLNPLFSKLGEDCGALTVASLSNNVIQMTDYPRYIKQTGVVSFDASITQFNEIKFGFGVNEKNGLYVKVDNTNIVLYRQYNTTSTSITNLGSEAHGLNIGTFIKVTMIANIDSVKIILTTIDGNHSKVFSLSSLLEIYGYPSVSADASTTLTNIELKATNRHFKDSVWYIGDSYVSIDTDRWPYYVETYNIKEFLLIGLAGGGSADLYPDLLKALNFGTPKYLIWGVGMNDKDTGTTTVNANWLSYFNTLKDKCTELGITLILTTIPNVSNSVYHNEPKNTIVKNSGYRYIDFAKAVNAESDGASWYSGMLSADGVHPTALGAKVLAGELLASFPEIMQY